MGQESEPQGTQVALPQTALPLVPLAAWVSGVFIALRVALFCVGHPNALYDDAYIYLRYAQNIFGDCPLSYNCADPPVEGFTSPLFLALLCLFHLVFGDLVLSIRWLCGVLLAATLILAALLPLRLRGGGDDSRWRAMACVGTAVALGMDEHILLNAVVGMDAPLGALAVAAIAHCLFNREQAGIRAVIPLAILARPECAAFVPFLLLLPRARTPRFWGPVVFGGLAIVLARWLVFHDILPNTFWAKSGGTGGHARLGLGYLGGAIAAWPWLLAAPLVLLSKDTRKHWAVLLLGSGAWAASFLRVGGDVYLYARFAFPLVPLATAATLVGVGAAVRVGARVWLRPALVAAVASGMTLWGVLQHDLGANRRLRKVEAFVKVAHFLGTLPGSPTVATTAIGATAYYSGLHIYDLVGLTNREVGKSSSGVPDLQGSNLGHERHNTEWVLARQPDLIMTLAFQDKPFAPGSPVKTDVYAEIDLISQLVKRPDYMPLPLRVAPDLYWFFFARTGYVSQLMSAPEAN